MTRGLKLVVRVLLKLATRTAAERGGMGHGHDGAARGPAGRGSAKVNSRCEPEAEGDCMRRDRSKKNVATLATSPLPRVENRSPDCTVRYPIGLPQEPGKAA